MESVHPNLHEEQINYAFTLAKMRFINSKDSNTDNPKVEIKNID